MVHDIINEILHGEIRSVFRMVIHDNPSSMIIMMV